MVLHYSSIVLHNDNDMIIIVIIIMNIIIIIIIIIIIVYCYTGFEGHGCHNNGVTLLFNSIT